MLFRSLVFSDVDGDGFFETVEDVNHFAGAIFNPNFVVAPVPGALSVVLFAAYQAQVQVARVDSEGFPVEPLGFGQAGTNGNLTVNLFRPLIAGERLVVQDFLHNVSSVPVTVTAPPPNAPILAITRVGNSVALSFNTQNAVIYQVQYKNFLQAPTWNVLQTFTGSGSRVTVPAPISSPARFFRVEAR